MVEPVRDCVYEETTGGGQRGGRGPELPVGLGVVVSVVQWDAEDLGYGGVEGGL